MVDTFLLTRLLDTKVYIVYISDKTIIYFGGIQDPSFSEFDEVDYRIEAVILQ